MKALTEKIRSLAGRIFMALGKSDKLSYRQLAEEAAASTRAVLFNFEFEFAKRCNLLLFLSGDCLLFVFIIFLQEQRLLNQKHYLYCNQGEKCNCSVEM